MTRRQNLACSDTARGHEIDADGVNDALPLSATPDTARLEYMEDMVRQLEGIAGSARYAAIADILELARKQIRRERASLR